MKITKEEYSLMNLKICIYEETATAETFENHIKNYGLDCGIIVLISDYYKNDMEDWRI